ncbi:MAG: hypothetical protein SOT82_02445 [Oscillospiraceae bacterium]|nr:hypothetical protein [Oscillospiraceae bacterium]
MKKWIALLLAAVMCLSLVACGSDGENSNNNQSEPTEYAIGEAFGTDNVECIVTGIKWVTPEEFDTIAKPTQSIIDGERVYDIDTELLFPECVGAFGNLGGIKSKISDQYFLLVTFSLQNCGKEVVTYTEKPSGTGYSLMPYGTFEVIYDDGYVFGCGTESGFTTTLAVLGDAIKTLGGCMVPSQVYENTDKPLKIKVILPNASGEAEEFIVSVR